MWLLPTRNSKRSFKAKMLEYVLTEEGRLIPQETEGTFEPEYFLKDHLGNVRVIFSNANSDTIMEVVQENHYYPFGMTLGGLNYVSGVENKNLYQGKEMQEDYDLNWADFHARQFNNHFS